MKTVLKVLAGLIAVVLLCVILFSIVVAMQPEDVRYERSLVMNAPPERAYEQVNDFRNWNAWSPWAKMDPNMSATYNGPATGVGSAYSWTGNESVGRGTMKITESVPPSGVKIDLEFLEPFTSSYKTEFTFAPEGFTGQSTNVTWTMAGKNNFMMKAFSLVMDMDKMIGADFERGLASMKTIVEAPPAN